jgi:hypothetical protein
MSKIKERYRNAATDIAKAHITVDIMTGKNNLYISFPHPRTHPCTNAAAIASCNIFNGSTTKHITDMCIHKEQNRWKVLEKTKSMRLLHSDIDIVATTVTLKSCKSTLNPVIKMLAKAIMSTLPTKQTIMRSLWYKNNPLHPKM